MKPPRPIDNAFSNEERLNWPGNPSGSKKISLLVLKVVSIITIIGNST